MSAKSDQLEGETPVEVRPHVALLLHGLAVIAMATAALLPPSVALYWLTIDTDAVRGFVGLGSELLPAVTMGQRIVAALIGVLAVLPIAWSLARLRIWLGSAAAGHPFAARGIAGLRDTALGALGSAVALLISHTPMSLALTWTAMAGHRRIGVSVDSQSLLLAIFAGTVAVVAWAMGKAAAIAEENSKFV